MTKRQNEKSQKNRVTILIKLNDIINGDLKIIAIQTPTNLSDSNFQTSNKYITTNKTIVGPLQRVRARNGIFAVLDHLGLSS